MTFDGFPMSLAEENDFAKEPKNDYQFLVSLLRAFVPFVLTPGV